MRHAILAIAAFSLLYLSPCLAESTDPFPSKPLQEPLDAGTITQALKAALTVEAERAVKTLSKPDGYFGDRTIRIDLPGELEHMPAYVSLYGYQAQLDALVLSMNRAAEKAAPRAALLFSDAIREMNFGDARAILNGGGTAATAYCRDKAYERLYNAYRPAIAASMNETGVDRSLREVLEKFNDVPAIRIEPFDLEEYVTGKALDGIFATMGEEEQKIRKNPAARSSELLRKVFGQPQ